MDIGIDIQKKIDTEAIGAAVREFIDIKYEMSLYVDDGLVNLGLRFDKALGELIKAANVTAMIDQ